MNCKVSVIIPTYNYGHFLDECLLSVLNQSYKNLEIIVIDDGSEDNTQQIISKYSSKINYIYQKNTGLSSARNTGLNYSTGDFIQFLDSDDLLHPYSIEQRIKNFELNADNELLVCQNKTFSYMENKKPKFIGKWPLFKNNLQIHLCYFNIAPPHAFLMSSRVKDEVGLFDTSLSACEDYDYWLRALAKGYTPKFSNKGMVYYRKHKNSMSHNKQNQYHHDALLHAKLYKLLYEDATNNIHINIASSAAFICGVLTTLIRLGENSEDDYFELMKLVRLSLDNLYACLNDNEVTINFEFLYYLMKINDLRISNQLDKKIDNFLLMLKKECLTKYRIENNLKFFIKSMHGLEIENTDKINIFKMLMRHKLIYLRKYFKNS